MLTALWEIFLQIVAEVLIEFGFGSIAESLRQRERAHPGWAAVGATLLGAGAGIFSSLMWPSRILGAGPLPGASLLLSPLATGLIMDRYGEWRERGGYRRSFLATFWGGALFAFAMALIRLIWVGMTEGTPV